MERDGYREAYELLLMLFPGRATINAHEAADAMGIDYTTVLNLTHRNNNPLPTVSLGKSKIIIPITGFAVWLATTKRKEKTQ